VQVNVNGSFSHTVDQQRGLRQGDPLSPILFNLALEPLLLAINQDNGILGCQYFHAGLEYRAKTLAYADDICTIISSPSDYLRLHYHLDRYAMVSNAKFNQEKTEGFALSGTPDENWKLLLLQKGRTVYHSNRSPEPFRYLGFYITYTTAQRDYLQNKLLTKVKEQVLLYSQRQLTLRGRVTVMNTLILSKIWYCLRLMQPTMTFFKSLQKTMYSFVWQSKKAPSFL
jgi:hypothetical protein